MPSPLPGTSAPSPALSTMSQNGVDRKRKRELTGPAKTIVELQREREYRPQETLGQMTLAVQYLKERGQESRSFDDLLRYLSLQNNDPAQVGKLRNAMTAGRHPKLAYDRSTQLFRYRPLIPVTNREELRGYLQTRPNALGVKVDDVKDGWPNCIPELESMAGRGEILLTRGGSKQKGQTRDQPKTIWHNDPTLCKHVMEEIKRSWDAISLPTTGGEDALRDRLLAAGLKPTTAPAPLKKVEGMSRKRKLRKSNKGASTNVNVPMKDYSHLRK